MMNIEKVSNGYIVTNVTLPINKVVFKTLDEVFNCLLSTFESRSKYFGGDCYGYVHIFREPNETVTSPSKVEPV